MKKLIIAFAAVLVTAVSLNAQGELNFNTRVPLASVDAPIFLPGGTQGPGPSFSAQLFQVGAGGALTAVGSPVTFRTAGTGGGAILDRYIAGGAVAVAGSPGGTTVTLRIRAWDTAGGSYDNARVAFGQSDPFQVTLSSAPATPSDFPSTLRGFTLTAVPEPSTIALGVLGAAALLIRRRK